MCPSCDIRNVVGSSQFLYMAVNHKGSLNESSVSERIDKRLDENGREYANTRVEARDGW